MHRLRMNNLAVAWQGVNPVNLHTFNPALCNKYTVNIFYQSLHTLSFWGKKRLQQYGYVDFENAESSIPVL
jgi:hypothetical protein